MTLSNRYGGKRSPSAEHQRQAPSRHVREFRLVSRARELIQDLNAVATALGNLPANDRVETICASYGFGVAYGTLAFACDKSSYDCWQLGTRVGEPAVGIILRCEEDPKRPFVLTVLDHQA